MVKVVEQGLYAEGRVDVRQLVMGAVDTAVGKEVDGVVLPRPKLRAAAQEWTAEVAIEVVEVTAVGGETTAREETAAATIDEAPKALVDGTGGLAAAIARVLASSRQHKEQEEQNKTKDLIARVLASSRQQKE